MTTHLELTLEMAQLLDDLSIRYVVGGSVASSLVGEPRSTVDVDIAVQLLASDLERLLEAVRPSFYVPETDAERAFRERDSFNLIHNTEAFKVDIFVLGDDVLDINQIERRTQITVPLDPPASLWVGSAEDQILRKLDWYRRGGQVSDRQWRDVIAILQVNSSQLDMEYLETTAGLVGLSDLLRAANVEADA